MPQEFQVLRCYGCGTFQVHQVKKVLKFNCKVCGEKQSIKKVYGRGSGADCRKHVQKCNMFRCELDMAAEQRTDDQITNIEQAEKSVSQEQSATSNKWQTFLDQPEDNNGENEVDDEEYTTSRQQFNQTKKDITKAARQRWKSGKQQKYGNYNQEGKVVQPVAEAFQEQKTFNRQYSRHQGTSKIAICQDEMNPVFSPSNQQQEHIFGRNNQQQNFSNMSQSNHSSPMNNNASFSAPNSAKSFSAGAGAEDEWKNLRNATNNKQKQNLPNAKKNSVKFTESRKTSSNDSNSGLKQSRWNIFLGDETKNEGSDDSDEDSDENDPGGFNTDNLSNVQFESFHQENQDNLYEENKHCRTQDQVPKFSAISSLYVEQSGSVGQSVVKSNQWKNDTDIFNVDDDLESMLEDNW